MPPLGMGKLETDVELLEGEEGGIFLDIHPHLGVYSVDQNTWFLISLCVEVNWKSF